MYKKRVDPQYHDKIKFQPCPTTMLSMYEKLPVIEQTNEIGICLAFDRFEYRFQISFDDIIDKILNYKNYCESIGYNIVFFIHSDLDLKHNKFKDLAKKGIKVEPLFGKSIQEVYEFYKSKKLIVGMRGHSLMIPFGLKVPCISLTNQDKQKFFMETIDHLDRSIEVNSDNFYQKLVKQTNNILNKYDIVVAEMTNKQKEFYNITVNNLNQILKNIR